MPSGVRNCSSRSAALRRPGLKPRMPSRASALFIRLPMRVRSLTKASRSRLGRLASSSARLGTATIVQWPRSPRSQPRKARCSSAASKRSVFARRCSRETAMLVAWITCASTPRARSQRASQKPSRPASKATAMRAIVRPAFAASSRQRCSSASNNALARFQLLGRTPLNTRNDRADQPARLAHLNHRNQRFGLSTKARKLLIDDPRFAKYRKL